MRIFLKATIDIMNKVFNSNQDLLHLSVVIFYTGGEMPFFRVKESPAAFFLRQGIQEKRLAWAGVSIMIFLSFFVFRPLVYADELEKGLKGFNEKIIRHEKALQALEKGKAFLNDGEYDLARKAFVSALELDKELIEARYCLGLVEIKAGNPRLALEHFIEVYKKKSDWKELCLKIADTHLRLGECDHAKTWLARHLKRNSPTEETRRLDQEIKKCLAKGEKRGE
jgi:tetratricopeptide (TPR) repeat protein